MATVAVVGGTGFLGRHVTEALRQAGHEPRALSRRTGFDALRPDAAALRGCDAVVNLAGIKREDGEQTFEAVHVRAVERLAGAMAEGGVRRLVHISVVVARRDPALPYHDTKARGEEAVRASGLDWTILRPGVIYGEGDDLLSHLSLMIRAAPVFPIVKDGTAPMMPVDARDVAAAVAGALRVPASVGKTFEIVGPDRLRLRDVVGRVAEALELPVRILPTPVALMRLPVRLMEATMRQPLSTRAQLAMLVEGLAGDPEPARRELGVEPRPFTPGRLRPLLASCGRRPPVDLRLFSAPRPAKEIPPAAAGGLYLAAAALLTFVFGFLSDRWMGMTLGMAALLAASLALEPVRRRFRPTAGRIAAGLASGLALYGLTRLGLLAVAAAWPGWDRAAAQLYSWKGPHSTPFLAATLVLIVAAEEFFWRGVITRFAMERLGRAPGILAGAVLYAAAHLATMNPLLLAAALALGLVWGWMYAATDSLSVPTSCHLAWDVLVMFVIPVAG